MRNIRGTHDSNFPIGYMIFVLCIILQGNYLLADPFSNYTRMTYQTIELYNPTIEDIIPGGNKEFINENLDVFTIDNASITKTFSLPISFGKVLGYGDLNNDTFSDIITSEGIYLNRLNGAFEMIPHIILNYLNIICEDFNNDNGNDILGFIYNTEHWGIQVLFGDAKGGVQEGPFTQTSKKYIPLEAHDFNKDGYIDILVSYETTFEPGISKISAAILFGKGAGVFNEPADIWSTDYDKSFVGAICHDFNHDNYIDILVYNSNNQLEMLLNDTRGDFSATWSSQEFALPVRPVLINNHIDQDSDVLGIFQDYHEETISETATFHSNGDGTFQQPEYDLIDNMHLTYFSSIINNDIDQNGIDDVVYLGEMNEAIRPVSIFFNLTPTKISEMLLPRFPFKINGVSPNPFNMNTTIQLFVNYECNIKISIYSSSGQCIYNSEYNNMSPGMNYITWGGNNNGSIASGLYICKIIDTQHKYYASTKLQLLK